MGPEGSKGSEGSKGKVSPLCGDEYEVSVTGFTFVAPVVHAEEQEPPSLGRGWRRQATKEQRQFFSHIFGVPQGFAQLHPGRANKRNAILNFSFSLEGNAAKRQRVYEGKNDNDAPLIPYAGPTSPDLAILCKIAT